MFANAQLLDSFNLLRWETWGVLTAGLLFAVLVVVVGLSPFFRNAPRSRQGDNSLFGAIHTFLTERRKGLRQKCRPVQVEVLDAETQSVLCEGELLDRSTRGLRLTVPRSFAVGIILRLRRVDDLDPNLRVFVEVKNSGPLPNKRWVIGCEVMPPSSGGSGQPVG